MSRIAVFLPASPWGDVTPETVAQEGMGGRETALVELVQRWGEMGHEVWAFVPLSLQGATQEFEPVGGTEEFEPVQEGVVHWVPNERVVDVAPHLGLDLFVSWEHTGVFEELGEAEIGTRAIEMQVAHLPEFDPELVDVVCVLSEWAKDFFLDQHRYWPSGKTVVLPNGIDYARFDSEPVVVDVDDPDGPEFIYSSSPDRGLHHLLAMWPTIFKRVLMATSKVPTLHVCYGVEKFVEASRWSHREDAERALTIEEELHQPGVLYHGKVGQDLLAALQLRCDAMLYPCDPMSPTETGCISIIEALAARCRVVTTDADCLGIEFVRPGLVDAVFVDELYQHYVDLVLDPYEWDRESEVSIERGVEFAKARDWTVIAKQWEEVFGL